MIAADALDRNNAARRDNLPRPRERIVLLRRPINEKMIGRAAHRARIRLCVKAAVGGVIVLALARRTHPKRCHRGQRAVIGNTANDRVARAAVRTVRKGVAVPPVFSGQNLTAAVRTDREVGRDKRPRNRSRRARQDLKALLPRRRDLLECHSGYRCRKRSFRAHVLCKRIESRRRPLRLDADARAVIPYASRQTIFPCKTVDKGAEPHALHNP